NLTAENFDPFRCCAFGELLIKEFGNRRTFAETVAECQETRIDARFRCSDEIAQKWPEFFLIAHEIDPAILCAIGLAGRERWVRRAGKALRCNASIQIPARHIIEAEHCQVIKA